MSELDAMNERQGRRRRRKRREPRRGLYLLPHLVTTAGLFFGFYAIAKAFTGDADKAALGIVLAAVCDALDGRLARLAHASSKFGQEYDSIADTVSFGVAPAVLAFGAGNLVSLGRSGWVIASLFTVCAALRLARFNVAPSRFRGRFEGLPSPAAAAVVATTQWFDSFLTIHGGGIEVSERAVAAGVVLLGLLMVSQIPYRSFKEMDVRHSYGTLVLVVIAIYTVVQEPSVSLFFLAVAYALHGPVELVWRKVAGKPLSILTEEPPPELSQG